MKIKKKIALVTGANKGIGKSIAKILSINNIIVIGTSRTLIGKNKINYHLGKNGFGIILNIKNIHEIKKKIKNIHKYFGTIDILINNAAIINDKLFINMKYNEWNNVLQTNLNSIFYISQTVIKHMILKKYGRIITIGSVIGNIGNIGQINYATSKLGIVGFNKTLALEVASKGITVNVISPGFIKTEMTKYITKKKKKKYLINIPIQRFGNTKDIAYAVLFLSSEFSSYITGQTIHINGGMYMN